MYVTQYDPGRVILVSIHVGEPLCDEDVDRIVSDVERSIVDAARHGGVPITNLVVVESKHVPTATQRRRLGQAAALPLRAYTALVTRSAMMRGVIIAVGWWSKGNPDTVQSTHATYEAAREWLVARSGHAASVFDGLEREARASLQGTEGPSIRTS